jgi:hypothetical protein
MAHGDDHGTMTIYIQLTLCLQAISFAWLGIATIQDDPPTTVVWLLFQLLISPFVAVGVLLGVVPGVVELAIPEQ